MILIRKYITCIDMYYLVRMPKKKEKIQNKTKIIEINTTVRPCMVRYVAENKRFISRNEHKRPPFYC